MPPALQLVDKHFGCLKVLHRDPNGKHGKSWWVCLCDPERDGCGKTVSVAAGHLVTGHTQSCSCLVQKNSSGRPFTKAAAQKKEVIRVDGVRYYAPRKACRLLKTSRNTLMKWANLNKSGKRTGCPWLEGRRPIATIQHPTAYNREITYYLAADVKDVAKAKAKTARGQCFQK